MVTEVLSLLADASFEGFVVSEVSQSYQNVRDLRRDVELTEHWFQQRESERSARSGH